MTIDDVCGAPEGVLPELYTLEHKGWLKESITHLYSLFKDRPDEILTNQYLGEMKLYLHLYSECYTGETSEKFKHKVEA